MVRLEKVSEEERKMLLGLPCPSFESNPWVGGPPLRERRLAIITTAGLHMREAPPFQLDPNDFYRVIPGDVRPNDLVMSHIAASFDRSGFQRDWNVVFPLDRLREMVRDGIIGSLADFHYCVSRPHTESIKPPRALWVPFQLGRPLGAPDDPAFQRRVLEAALGLLEAPKGPVLEDFPEEEPEHDAITVLSCPVRDDRSTLEDRNTDPLLLSFRREMTGMRPWYDMALNKRQRTTVGVSGMSLEALPDFLYAFVKGEEPPNPHKDVALAYTLKLAAEDLKAYYIEGVTAQPGQANVSARVLQDWFWDETVAGEVLLAIKKACETSPDKMLNMMGSHFIVPGDVARRQAN